MFAHVSASSIHIGKHFDLDEPTIAAVFNVLFEHGMSCRAGAGKAVEDDGVFVSGDLQDALNQAGGFWCDENIIRGIEINQFEQFLLAFLCVANLSVKPHGLGYPTIFNLMQESLGLRNGVAILAPPDPVIVIQLLEFFF